MTTITSLAIPAAPALTLAHFDRARLALERAATIDEVKAIRNQAEALRLYVRQSRQGLVMQNRCAEIKLRAERKAGTMLAEMPKNAGTRLGGPVVLPPDDTPTLADLSIGKMQSSRWQTVAGIPEVTFERFIRTAYEGAEDGQELTTAGLLRATRADRRPSGTEPPPLPAGVFDLILCDPPWRYEFVEAENRAIENHYATMSLDEIKALELPRLADDALLLMWATPPKLAEALEVVAAWKFDLRSSAVWVKDRIGMGYWFRQRHELLLVCRRGDFAAPEPAARPDSVIEAPRGAHSKKPDQVYDLIERMFPRARKVELFARGATRTGWTAWGTEAAATAGGAA